MLLVKDLIQLLQWTERGLKVIVEGDGKYVKAVAIEVINGEKVAVLRS